MFLILGRCAVGKTCYARPMGPQTPVGTHPIMHPMAPHGTHGHIIIIIIFFFIIFISISISISISITIIITIITIITIIISVIGSSSSCII